MKHFVAAVIAVLLTGSTCLCDDASSYSMVIGGADGPTSVFIAGKEDGEKESIIEDVIASIRTEALLQKYTKTYKLVGDLSEDEVRSIVYSITDKASAYTTENRVTFNHEDDQVYVEISLPGIDDDDAYAEVIRQPKLEFIFNYGTESEEVVLTGAAIEGCWLDNYIDWNNVQQQQVRMELDQDGTKRFADITCEHVGEKIAIILDGTVLTEPWITAPIADGNVCITGGENYSNEALVDLVTAARVGYSLIEIN